MNDVQTVEQTERVKMFVGKFELIDYGIDHSQYFPGITAMYSEYDHAVFNVGETRADALAQCIDSLIAQQWQVDLDISAIERSNEYAQLIECTEDAPPYTFLNPAVTEDEIESGEIECELYYHVGIRYSLLTSEQWTQQELNDLVQYQQTPSLVSIVRLIENPPRQYGNEIWVSNFDYSNNHLLLRNHENTFIILDCASYSDYSGSTVTRANYEYCAKWLFEDASNTVKLQGKAYKLTGDGFFRGIAVRIDALDLELSDIHNFQSVTTIRQAIESISNYPALNDELVGAIEQELQAESWERHVKSDFTSALHKRFDCKHSFQYAFTHLTFEDLIDTATNASLQKLLRVAMDKSNTYYEHETAVSVYLDIDRTVDAIDEDLLINTLKVE